MQTRISMEHGQQILAQNTCHIFCQCQRAHMGPAVPPHGLGPHSSPRTISPGPSEATGHISSPVPPVHGLSLAHRQPMSHPQG